VLVNFQGMEPSRGGNGEAIGPTASGQKEAGGMGTGWTCKKNTGKNSCFDRPPGLTVKQSASPHDGGAGGCGGGGVRDSGK